MTNPPFRTTPALMLSLPGVLLVLAATTFLIQQPAGTIELSDYRVTDLAISIIAAGLFLTLATLVATPIALFYTFRRSGNGLLRTGFATLNILLLIFALGCLAALLLAVAVVLFNPG